MLSVLVAHAQVRSGEASISFTTKKVGETVYLDMVPVGSFTVEGMTLNEKDGSYTVNAADVTISGAFKQLSMNDMGITSLRLSNQAQMELFSCSLNELTSLDCSEAPHLKTLFCPFNKLTSLDLTKNEELESAMIYDNPSLENLDASHLPALKVLYASSCSLRSVDLSNNDHLEVVDLYRNKLQELVLDEHPRLLRILAGGNKLKKINLSGCKNLQSLYIQENQIEELLLDGFEALKVVEANNNNLSNVTIAHCPLLTNIKLQKNRISSLDLTTLPSLIEIEVEHNELLSLQVGANNKLNFIAIYDNQLNKEAMDDFVATIGKPFDSTLNPYIDIVDSSLQTEKNSATPQQVQALREKGWHVYDFKGSWADRTELMGSEASATSLSSLRHAYIAGDILMVPDLDAAGAMLYSASGEPLLFIEEEQTDLSSLPSGVYVLVNGRASRRLIR